MFINHLSSIHISRNKVILYDKSYRIECYIQHLNRDTYCKIDFCIF